MGLCYLMVCLRHAKDLFWVSRSFASSRLAFFIYLFIFFLRAGFRAEPQLRASSYKPGQPGWLGFRDLA